MAGLLDTEARPRGITTAMGGMYVQMPVAQYDAMIDSYATLEARIYAFWSALGVDASGIVPAGTLPELETITHAIETAHDRQWRAGYCAAVEDMHGLCPDCGTIDTLRARKTDGA